MRLVRNNVRKNTENPRRDEEEWKELKNTFSGELDFSAKIKANQEWARGQNVLSLKKG